MATKIIHFIVGKKQERAEFRSDSPPDDVKDCFRAAAEAGDYDILKLYNRRGNIVNISPALEENTPDSPYKLEVVATQYTGTAAREHGFDIESLELRLQNVEKKVVMENGVMPPIVYDLKNKVESFREKLESVEHLSWLGLFKNFVSTTNSLPFSNGIKIPREELYRVTEIYRKMSTVQISEDVRLYLRKVTFDNWQWEPPEMMVLLQQMYIDLGFMQKFGIEFPVLQNFLCEVYQHYNRVPFHNFRHCFAVAQMMYGLVWLADLPKKIGNLDVMALITASICHDLDHPGLNNAYQVNARTPLAILYNDVSPLENHHCAVAFEILEMPHCNILKNLSPDQYKEVREGIIRSILATDMSKHNTILNDFKSILPNFDGKNEDHKNTLMKVLIKVSDISNEARPMEVAEPWVDCLLTEFFTQSDQEKLAGLPVAPHMDREKVTKPSSQTGFIRFVLLPLFESLGTLYPEIEEPVIMPVRKALDYYSKMANALAEEKKRADEKVEKDKQGAGGQSSNGQSNGKASVNGFKDGSVRAKRVGSASGRPNKNASSELSKISAATRIADKKGNGKVKS